MKVFVVQTRADWLGYSDFSEIEVRATREEAIALADRPPGHFSEIHEATVGHADVSTGELDALCREHRVTLVCSGSHWTASQQDGREARGSCTHRDMAQAVLGLVAKLEGRS